MSWHLMLVSWPDIIFKVYSFGEGNMSQEAASEQTIGINAQYVKDLSFENVGGVAEFAGSEEQPQIDVQLKVNVEKGKQDDVYHVGLLTNIHAKAKDATLFVLELNYVGDFVVKGFPADMMEPLLYIECPRLLFPFVRSIIAGTVSDGGFPPLYLVPVNFADLYQQQKDSKQQTLQ